MSRCATLALAAILAIPAVCAAEWTEIRSANFRFIGDARERDIREIAARLEQFREVLRHIDPGMTADSPVPTVVFVFADMKTFAPYQPVSAGRRVSNVAGYFQAADIVNYIAISADGGPAAIRLIFHEYTHFLVSNSFGEMPAWFTEGVAQLYETLLIRDEGRTAIVGTPLPQNLALLSQRSLMPLEELVGVRETLSVLHERSDTSVFYAQSWALLHYLMLGDPGRNRQLREYVARIARGELPEPAFDAVFGADARTIQRDVAGYARQLQFAGRLFPFDDRVIQSEIPPGRPLADEEAEAYLADLLARTQRRSEARQRLEKLLAADPGNAHAAFVLGWLELHESRLDVALPLLERAAASRPGDAAIQGALGMARYERARRFSSDRASLEAELARAREALTRAVTLDGRVAPVLATLADVETASTGDFERARELIDIAVALAPARLEYKLARAETLLRLQEVDAAREQLEALAARDPSLPTTSPARELLNHLTGAEVSGEPVAGVRRPALRIVQEGERRVYGRFVRVECGGPIVQFHVATDEGMLRFTEVLGGVQVIAYAPAAPSFSCGNVRNPPVVLATYRPGSPGAQAGGADMVHGVVVALEIVPEGFVP